MLKVSNEFNEAFKSDLRQILVRLTIAGKIYENQDLTSVSYDGGSISGNTFAIGSTVMNSIKVTFCNLVEGLKELDEVKLEIGVVLPTGTVEYAPMGIFIIDGKINMDRNENRTSIECQDRMCILEGGYKSKLVYPTEIRQVALEIANLAGVKVNEASFAGLSDVKITEPVGYTYRQALGLVAQFQVGFVRFDRAGLLDIRGLEDPEYTITANEYFLKGLAKNEVFYRLGGISCKTGDKEEGDLQSGSISGAQITLENKVMTQDILDSIYEQLRTINYYPYELSWRGNPAIEAGDWLKLEDRQGNIFKTPNLSYNLEFKGGLTAKSSASTDVQSSTTYGYKGNLNQKIQWIQDQVVDGMGNTVSTGIDEPAHPKDGDTWFKKVGPDTEIRVYENGVWVFKTTTAENPEIKNAIDEAQKDAEAAKKQAQEAYDKSLKAIEDAGFSKDQAKQALDAALQAIEDAGFSKDQAKQALDAALQSGADAIQAGKDAVEALNNAKNALKNINDLDQTVKTEITNINDELSQKVSQDTYDGLAGTVKNQSTLISQNKNEIALKADTSIVNTIKGTVDKNTAAILVNTNGIKLKADQSTVNTLTGRVTSAEGKLIVQAGHISQTVSKTELEGKGFATQTWTQGQIKTTADNINLSVSKVKTSVDNLGSLNHAVVSRFSPGFLNESETLTAMTGNKEYTTDYIPVGKNTHIVMTYFYKKANPSKWTAYQFFNKDKKVLGGRPYQDALVTADGKWLWNIDIPKDVVYVRMSARWLDGDIGKDKLKIEFGTTQTAWSLAPEDGASQTDFASIEIKVNGIKLKADQSTVNALTGRVTTAEGKLIVQAGQISQTVSKTELEGKGFATQTWTQGQIKTTADNIQLSVSKVQNNLDNVQIGGRNYALGTSTKFSFKSYKNLKLSAVPKNSEFTITAEVNQIGGSGKVLVGMSTAENKIVASVIASINKGRISATIKTDENSEYTQLIIYSDASYPESQNVNVVYEKIMVSLGNKGMDWTPAPEELASEIEFSNLEIKVNGIQSTVAGKADQSQVTQLASQWTAVVGDLGGDNMIYDGSFSQTKLGTQPEWWGKRDYITVVESPTDNAIVQKGTPVMQIIGHVIGNADTYASMMPVKAGDEFYGEMKARWQSAATTGSIVLGFILYDSDKKIIQTAFVASSSSAHDWKKLSGTLTMPANTAYARPLVSWNGKNPADRYVMVTDLVMRRNSATQGQITLLKNDINLRVQKGDVINQINISPEGILIDGKKTHITGQTTIDNAVIKDAMIADVKAGKITAGTINAANVNIINLNASNITAGVITGANLSINLQNGQVVFQKGRIHSTSNNIDISLDKGYVSVANDQARVLLKNGGIQMVQPNIFNEDKDPYLSIGNTGGIIGAHGANFVAKDYITMTNSKNQGVLTFPLGIEKMAGISFGYSGTWEVTKIGGADRGILLSGGHKMSSGLNGADLYGSSPNIIVGSGNGSGFAGNRVTINGEYVHIKSAYRHTGSGSANVVVAADGALTRSTSASKYKTDITRSFETDYGGKLMNLPTATWTDIAETKRYMDEPLNQPKPTPNFGMIAEDLADAGLEMLVVRGLDGELEGINYDRIGPALIPVIAQLKNKIEELTHKMEETS
ncbi:gp58-like family protein [Dellaglioa algida]|uniref:gp58-like family protein n=1 Tax=Dellaglioa algida TaxID=105612 RepID=UPI0024C48D86|nr:gp58-like family protein [Dellaglioa algida]MDK1716639.1 gp58-like family protein [Dellaglioa algida]MDK1721581.1 gp58-like family protein [Dellaglioa algida]